MSCTYLLIFVFASTEIPCILFRSKQKIRNRLLCHRAMQSFIHASEQSYRLKLVGSFFFHSVVVILSSKRISFLFSTQSHEREATKNERSSLKSYYLIRQTCHVFTLNLYQYVKHPQHKENNSSAVKHHFYRTTGTHNI